MRDSIFQPQSYFQKSFNTHSCSKSSSTPVSSTVFPCTLAKSPIGSRAAETQTSAPKTGYRC